MDVKYYFMINVQNICTINQIVIIMHTIAIKYIRHKHMLAYFQYFNLYYVRNIYLNNLFLKNCIRLILFIYFLF